MKWIKIMVAVMALILIGGFIWYLSEAKPAPDYKTRAARIKSIKQMVDLCTVDINEEVPIKDSINGKWIVARQNVSGRIRFNLDSLKIEERGDTTIVYLPPEKVEVLENASPGAYEILDSWDGRRPIFGRVLTTAEENRLKARWQNRIVRRIYNRGYVRQARSNAVNILTPLFGELQGPFGKQGPVVIIDPTPSGSLAR